MSATTSLPVESGEHGELRAQLRRLLERQWTAQQRLAFTNGDRTQSAGIRDVLVREIGIHGLLVPEELGGSGARCREVVIVAEELGAALAPSNILGSSMMAYVLAQASGSAATGVLEQAIRRGAYGAFVWPGADVHWADPPPATIVDGRLRGHFTQVADVEDASVLVVPAAEGDAKGVAWLKAGPGVGALRMTPSETPDVFRVLADIDIQDANTQLFAMNDAVTVWSGALALGALVLSAEMVGAGMECVQRIVDYGVARKQFGRPIATFQAVKHRLADALIELEAARALTYRAADLFPQPTAPPPEPEVVGLTRMAKAAASDALRRAALECIQLHGAIGFTWDHPAHLYLKRWATSSSLYGQSEDQRRLVYQQAAGHQATNERRSSVIH